MLSIIISSYQPHYFSALEKNIAETCGVPYEILKIENPGKMGICEAYNIGAEKAKYENLLFVHEDVLFETKNWGKILVDYLQNSKIGCVGIAGSDYIPNCPFAWWDNAKHQFVNLDQYNKVNLIRKYRETTSKELSCFDGVFIACRKTTYNLIRFDETVTGYHMYDITFSSNVSQYFTNVAISTIVLRHFSEGKTDVNWFESLIKFRRKFSAPTKQLIDKKTELYYLKKYIDRQWEFKFPIFKRIVLTVPYLNPRYIGWKIIPQIIYSTIHKRAS